MKKLILGICLVLCSAHSYGFGIGQCVIDCFITQFVYNQVKDYPTPCSFEEDFNKDGKVDVYEKFFNERMPEALAAYYVYGMPPGIFLVQAAHESALGGSRLAKDGLNFFGMVYCRGETRILDGRVQVWNEKQKSGAYRGYTNPVYSFLDRGRLQYNRLYISNLQYLLKVSYNNCDEEKNIDLISKYFWGNVRYYGGNPNACMYLYKIYFKDFDKSYFGKWHVADEDCRIKLLEVLEKTLTPDEITKIKHYNDQTKSWNIISLRTLKELSNKLKNLNFNYQDFTNQLKS